MYVSNVKRDIFSLVSNLISNALEKLFRVDSRRIHLNNVFFFFILLTLLNVSRAFINQVQSRYYKLFYCTE